MRPADGERLSAERLFFLEAESESARACLRLPAAAADTVFFVLPGILITLLSFMVFYVEPEACE